MRVHDSRLLCRLLAAFLLAACGRSGPDAATLNARGQAHAAKGELAPAMAAYDSAIARDSTLASVWRNRGVAWSQQERYDRALADFDRAVALDPANASLFNSRGVAKQGRGDYDGAIKEYSEAIRLKPDHALAIKGRGRCLFYLGRFAEAATDLARGVALDSTNAYVVLWLHIANQRTAREDAAAFTANLARTDSLKWPGPVGRYYLGHLDAAALRAAGAAVDPRVGRDQQCAAEFFFAEESMVKDRWADAQRGFEAARDGCPASWTEHQAAVAELARMGAASR